MPRALLKLHRLRWRGLTEDDDKGLRDRISSGGEEAIGNIAQALLENPVFSSALGKALGAGERAASAQRSAMGALNFASASDVERLEQRLRSLSGRLEAIEDRLDEVVDELSSLSRRLGGVEAVSPDQGNLAPGAGA
jgi:chromosome segregation ATPase